MTTQERLAFIKACNKPVKPSMSAQERKDFNEYFEKKDALLKAYNDRLIYKTIHA